MAQAGNYNPIPDQVFDDINLSQITSIREDSLSELIRSLKEDKLRLSLNPYLANYELEQELSPTEKLLNELIRVAPLLISMVIGTYAIHVYSLMWMLPVFLLPLVYFFRYPIISLIAYIVPSLLLVVALSVFVYWNLPVLISGATLFLGVLWVYAMERYKSNRLIQKALNSEVKFIELYFKNVLLVFRDKKILNSPEEVEGFVDFSYKHFPKKLNGKERLYLCKRCLNRDYSQQKGIVCGLTKAKPDFEIECLDFNADLERIEYEDSIFITRLNWLGESELITRLVPYLLYLSCGVIFLSEVNFWYSGRFFSVFRSGLTEWLYLKEIYLPETIAYGLIMPAMFLAAGVLARTGKRWAFVLGFAVFLTDTIFTFLSLGGTFNWWVHLGILSSLFAGIKELDTFKSISKSLFGQG